MKIRIALPPSREGPSSENVWATAIEGQPGLYEVDNSCWFARNVGYGDVVRAVPDAYGTLWFVSVYQSANRCRFSVRLPNGRGARACMRYSTDLAQHFGGLREHAVPAWFVVDAPQEQAEAIAAHLFCERAAGRIKAFERLDDPEPDTVIANWSLP